MKNVVPSPLSNLIIEQEKQLLARTDPVEVLCKLIDDEFIEIGSSSQIHDKDEVVRWLSSPDQSERTGIQFKTKQLTDDVILVTYISCIKENPSSETKQALRSSIWRRTQDRWQMVFHQGTPCVR